MSFLRRHLRDPRLLQIASLTGILIYGVGWRGLDVEPVFIPVILATALYTQWLCTRWTGGRKTDPRSALISALSLCLLMRGTHVGWAILAAVLAIGSKFSLRIAGKHIFNPTNLAVTALMLASDQVWVSPGQWGSAPAIALLMAGAGTMVVTRAARADVTLAFIAAYASILFGRAFWLGQPWATPWNMMQSGALVLFSFFMISDPKTTPDSRAGRILFAILVAVGAGCVHFLLYRPNGLLWSLVAFSPLVPLIDRWLPGKRYAWQGAAPVSRVEVPATAGLVPAPVFTVTSTDATISARTPRASLAARRSRS